MAAGPRGRRGDCPRPGGRWTPRAFPAGRPRPGGSAAGERPAGADAGGRVPAHRGRGWFGACRGGERRLAVRRCSRSGGHGLPVVRGGQDPGRAPRGPDEGGAGRPSRAFRGSHGTHPAVHRTPGTEPVQPAHAGVGPDVTAGTGLSPGRGGPGTLARPGRGRRAGRLFLAVERHPPPGLPARTRGHPSPDPDSPTRVRPPFQPPVTNQPRLGPRRSRNTQRRRWSGPSAT